MTEEALFHAALAVPPADRAAYLAEHCLDPDQRRRVEELLAVHGRPAGPLDGTPATGEFQPAAGSQLPDAQLEVRQIGPYKLLQRIGEGGMGAVYMAEQQRPVRRMVAVKVIKPGMDSAQVVARFEAERQALAMMDHPNIARVLDAGTTESGRPYFVMELVKGIPITTYCDQQHLTPRERLELFVPVCHAVQHAHQKGVIHRDLKPTNVLVALYDGRPVPKVIDFGVAKALHNRLTEKTMFTEFGAIVGTLEYMSPEQAELNQLDIDTRSDIYSLGVLLYELLTGSTPFDRKRLKTAAFDELLRIIREEEPPKPSTRLSGSEELPAIAANRRTEPKRLGKLVRGELDWVVMKCLEKDRGRRYETANGLAMDVQRYLADDMVQARPPTAGYRLRKFVRRYKGPLAATVAFVMLLVAATGVSLWLAAVAHEKEATAVAAEASASTERDAANTARNAEQTERRRADAALERAKASARDARRFADGLAVEKGLKLAADGKLFDALAWFAKPLERDDLPPDEERIHRLRLATHMRYAPNRMALRQVISTEAADSIRFSPDGRRLLVCSGTTFSLFDLVTSTRVGEPVETGVRIESARFQPDGQHVAVAGWKFGAGFRAPVIQTWNVERRAMIGPVIAPAEHLVGVLFALAPVPPGSVAATSSGAWFANNGNQLLNFSRLMQLSDDGCRAAVTAGRSATVWDVRTGRPIGSSIVHPFVIASVQFSPDSRSVLYVGSAADGQETHPEKWVSTVVIQDLESGGPGIYRGDSGPIYGASFSQSGRFFGLVTWRQLNNILTIFDAKTGSQIREESFYGTGDSGDVVGIQLLPARGDSLLIVYPISAAASRDKTYLARSISPRDGEQWQLLSRNWCPTTISVSPDRDLAVLGNGSFAQVWDLSGGQGISPFFPSEVAVPGVFSPDGRLLAQGVDQTSVRIWDLAGIALGAGEYDRSIRRPPADDFGGGLPAFVRSSRPESDPYVEAIFERLPADLGTNVRDLMGSPDGSVFATQHGDVGGGEIRLWDARTGARIGQSISKGGGHSGFSRDGRYFVTQSNDRTVVVDTKRGDVRQTIPDSVFRGFRHDGRVIYYDTDQKKHWLLDLLTGSKETFQVEEGSDAVWSHDNRKLVHFGNDVPSLQLFSTIDGKALSPAVSSSVRRVAFSPDDRIIAVHSGSDISLFEVPSLASISPPIMTSSGQRGLWFNAAGTRLETNDGDCWDLTLPAGGVPSKAQSSLAAMYAGFMPDDLGTPVAHTIDSVLSDADKLPLRHWLEYARNNRLLEVTVTPEACLRWREDQIYIESAFHRRWLAAELLEANWRPKPDDYRDVDRHFKRLHAYAAFGPAAVATEAVDALVRKYPKSHSILFDAGKTFSLAAGAAKDAAAADRDAVRAVALLRASFAAGRTDASEFGTNGDFDPLRKRPDFAALLWDLADSTP